MKKVLFIIVVILEFILITSVYADTTPPTTYFSTQPSSPDGDNGWFINYPQIELRTQDDESGIKTVHWRINDEPWQEQDFSVGFNLIKNPSFEHGSITDWNHYGSYWSYAYKASFRQNSGNYSAGIINLSWNDAYWVTDKYLKADPLETYNYSLHLSSLTSWLDNGFYQIVSISNGNETVLAEEDFIDLKLNFVKYSGTFTTPSDPDQTIIVRAGLRSAGELNIDDVSVSKSALAPEIKFTLNREGENIIQYYSVDGEDNIEETKSSTVKVDVTDPLFTNFDSFDDQGPEVFASRMDVEDEVSGLISDPAYFNYSVDGSIDGYYNDYGSCEGNFKSNEFLSLDTNYSTGAESGVVSTPVIDYCDTVWINCKNVNFYVKDIAGNEGSRSICVKGPYIATQNANIYARNNIVRMGYGDEANVEGTAVAGIDVSNVNSDSGDFVSRYSSKDIPNPYEYYYRIFTNEIISTTDITDNEEGIFNITGDYTIDSELNYDSKDQIVFVDGNLTIDSNINSINSNVFYLVTGNIQISNSVDNIGVSLISNSRLSTAENYNTINTLNVGGILYGGTIDFTRNVDKTEGASERVIFPLKYYLEATKLDVNNLYWKEITD